MSPAVVFSALAAVVLWGAAAPVTKIAVADLPPLAVGALRIILASAAVLPLALLRRVPWPRTGPQWRLLGIAALAGFIGFPLLFSAGLARTSAIHGAMMLALLPVMTGAIARAWDRAWPAARWWLGCAIAFLGEGVLIASGASGEGARGPGLTGDALVIAAGVVVAWGYVAGGRLKQAGYPSQGTTYWGIVAASVILIPLLPWLLEGLRWDEVSGPAWAGVAFLAFGASTLGYILWFWALGSGDIHRVGSFQFVQPLSGVLIAWAVLGEPLTAALWLATALVLVGVWLAARAGAGRAAKDGAASAEVRVDEASVETQAGR